MLIIGVDYHLGTAGSVASDDPGTHLCRRARAGKRPEVSRLMTHPGVGPLTALAYVLIIAVDGVRFVRGTESRAPAQ